MLYGLSTVTAPTEEPVSLSEAKLHLRVETEDDSSHILGLITAARMFAEKKTRRAFMTQTLRMTLDGFPSDAEAIQLPRNPVQSIVSIGYVDSNGDSQTMSASDYVLDATQTLARVFPVYAGSWPSVLYRRAVVTIDFNAGWASAALVPEPIKQAIKIMIGTYYDEVRSGVIVGDAPSKMPMAAEYLLGVYRAQGCVY